MWIVSTEPVASNGPAVSSWYSNTGASAAGQAEAAADADIVVLAVPGMLVEEITRNLGDLSGKIVIDPTNPLVMRDDGKLEIEVLGGQQGVHCARCRQRHFLRI